MPLDIFEQILFGNGAYIGFLVIIIMCFVAITLYKYLGIITSILTFFFGYRYMEIYQDGSQWFLWLWILAWICSVLEVYYMIKRKE